MRLFRRRLRVLAAAWLFLQAATLSALVPRACCLAHQAAAHEQGTRCHDAPPVSDCHSPAADGAPCPMHLGHGGSHDQAGETAPASARECAMRGTCGGPAAALLALLSHTGVLTDTIALPDLRPALPTHSSSYQLTALVSPPDDLPPRA